MKTILSSPWLRAFLAALSCVGVIATDSARGELIGIKWAKQYDGTNYPNIFGPGDSWDEGKAIAVDSAGNAFVAAQSDGFYVSKYSGTSGALLWEKRVGTGTGFSDVANAIATDGNGDVIAAGVLGTDFYTAKYAGNDGHLLWEQRYNGIGNDSDGATHLVIDSAGNAIVTGYTVAYSIAKDIWTPFGDLIHIPAATDIYTVKYDGVDGHVIWEQRYDGPAQDNDYPAGLALDPSGNVIVTGHAGARLHAHGSPDIDIYTVKYAGPTGAILWEQWAGGENYDYATGLAVDRFGNVGVNGVMASATSVQGSYTAKYSGTDGSVLWERHDAPDSILSLGPIAADNDGNLAVAGTYKAATSPIYGAEAYVAKLDGNNGTILWEKKYPFPDAGPWAGQAPGSGGGSSLKIDSAGNIVVGGMVAINTNPYHWRLFAAGYSPDGTTLWEKTFSAIGPQYEETFGGLALDAQGAAFLTGTLFPRPSGDDIDMFVVKLAPVGQLLNISSRTQVETGDKVTIGGFIVAGPANAAKKVLIRGLGPSLAAAGVSGILQDPTLELRMADGTVVRNNDWKDNQRAEIEATGMAPANDSEAAIVATLPPGAYTVLLRGNNNGAGIGLVELYDLDGNGLTNLANISTRSQVATGDRILISGFIVDGNQPARMLVRALGPSLTSSGVSGAIQDPRLEIHDANGVTITNDDWRATQASQIIATGIAPQNDKESAILVMLSPGPYTALVRSANDASGVAMVEAYNLQ